MKVSPFQVGILIFFVIAAILALLVFTGVIGGSKKTASTGATGTVVIWGSYPADVMNKLISDYNDAHQSLSVKYKYITPQDLDSTLSDAIASGNGPDLVILNQDQILKEQAKLLHIPYQSMPERTFRDTYIQEGELFLYSDGVIGLPFTIDPLVMYYNRDILQAAGITQPPTTWNDLIKDVPLLTKKDANVNILQSAIPFGIYGNLNHARDIISLLLLQAGNNIVTQQGGQFMSVLGMSSSSGPSNAASAQAVVSFFTQFVDPTKDTYTWNRSFQNARDQFINGELAIYLGYTSELPLIAAQNPNLNFDVAKVPQASVTSGLTFGNVQAISFIKASKNLATAIKVASDFTGADFETQLLTALTPVAPVAPARRDLLSQIPQSLFGPTLYSSAIMARGWYDPGEDQTNAIFSSMVDDVVRGSADPESSVGAAQSKFQVIFGN